MIPAFTKHRSGVVSYVATVLADSPVAFWELNELTGTTANDSSGNALSGTYTGGYTLGAVPPVNAPGAVLLDGSSGYVNCGTPAALNLTAAWTLEAWVYLTSTPSGSALIAEAYTGGANSVLYMLAFVTAGGSPASTLAGGYYASSTWHAIAGPTPSLNTWHHTAVTWDGTTLRLYLDGIQVATGVPSSPPVSSMDGVYLGQSWDIAGSPYLPGRMACAAIYGTALSAARILAHYNAGN
jgi:hypothetical protein